MPKREEGAVASKRRFATWDLIESEEAVALADDELMQAVAVADARAFGL